MSDAKLKSLVERIENLEEERKAIGADVKDIYTEAKGNGYNPKALRKVVAQRRQKTDEQLEAEVEAYRAALGMASYRAVSAALGVSKSKLQRLVPREENGTKESCGSVESRHAVLNPAMPKTTASTGAVASEPTRGGPPAEESEAGVASGPQDSLTIPDFLKRERATA